MLIPTEAVRAGRRATRSPLRVVGVSGGFLAVSLGGGYGLTLLAAPGWPRDEGATRVDQVIAGILGWIGVGLAGWLAVGAGLSLLAALPGAAGEACAGLAQRLTPALARRLLSMALGASVGTLALPAPTAAGADGATGAPAPSVTQADSAPSPGFVTMPPATRPTTAPPSGFSPSMPDGPTATRSSTPTEVHDVVPSGGRSTTAMPVDTAPPEVQGPGAPAPGWTPSAPVASTDPDRSRLLSPLPRPGAAATDTVTVRRGDSLWSLAARHLGPAASDAEIAREWPRWYSANRSVIGDDPDLLRPGQQLVVPAAQELAR